MDRLATSPGFKSKLAGGGLARALLVLSAAFLPVGLTLPVLETTRLWVFKSSYSILETIQALASQGEWLLAGLIALFSCITPTLKGIILVFLHLEGHRMMPTRLVVWVEHLGKWSMADVFVVSLLIVLHSNHTVNLAAAPGLWFFAASALLLMLASGRITADLLRDHAQGSSSQPQGSGSH